jgi:hypothetical protein
MSEQEPKDSPANNNRIMALKFLIIVLFILKQEDEHPYLIMQILRCKTL